MSAVPTILGDPGPAIASTDVDWAIIGVLRTWLSTWLRITSNERSLDPALKAPDYAGYANALDQGEWLDRWVPAVLVTTARTNSPTTRLADGRISVSWEAVVSVIVRGTKPSETRDRASLYEVAVRRCLGHRNAVAGAGGVIHSARWLSTQIAPVGNVSRTARYLAAGMATFSVITDAALKDTAAPLQPVADGDTLPDYVPTVPVDPAPTIEIDGYSPNQNLGG